MDAGVAQVTAIAQTVIRSMPPGTTPPLIIRYSASTVPILQYSISSPKLSEQEVFDLTANQVRVGLSTVQGALHALALRRQERAWSRWTSTCRRSRPRTWRRMDVVNAINAQNLDPAQRHHQDRRHGIRRRSQCHRQG